MMWFITILLAIIAWHGIGWAIVIMDGLISSQTMRLVVDKIESIAEKSEKISPYLALFIMFGPMGLLMKKALYGNKD